MQQFLLGLSLIFSLYVSAQVDIKKADSLKTLIKTAKGDEKTEVYVRLIEVYEYKANDTADYYTRKLIEYGKKNKLPKAETRGLLIKAKFFIQTSQYDSAHSYYQKAEAKLKTFEDYQLNSIYYGDQGVLNFYQGDFKQALENFTKALELAKQNAKKDDILTFLNNTALAMSYLGKAEESIDVHKEAIELAAELNDSTALGRSFNNLGLIYEDMDALEKALEYYQKALLIKEDHGTPQDILNGKYNVAAMHRELAERTGDTVQLNRAEKEFTQILIDAEAEKYGKVILFTKTALAQVATSKGDFQKAISLYLPVIESAASQNDNQTLRVAYLNVGSNYFEMQNYIQAKKYLELAEPLITQADNPSDNAKLYKNLAKTYYQLGEYKKAYENFDLYEQASEILIDENLQQKITDFEVKYETEQKENEILKQRAEIAEKDLEVRRKNLYLYGSIGLAALLGLFGYLIYSRQKLKNKQLQKESELQIALAKIETQNRLEEQRLRISRDLHDNIGSQLTYIIMSLDTFNYMLDDAGQQVKDRIHAISAFTSVTINELRDTIWAMNKGNISLEDLQARIARIAERAQENQENLVVSLHADLEHEDFELSSIEGINIYRIVQEALNNAIKYAEAQHIKINLSQTAALLKISVKDDGKGFSLNENQTGNGLNNMRKRAADIDAQIELSSEPGKGTLLILTKDLA